MALKRVFDALAALLGLLVLLLPMLVVGLIVKLSSRGPILYRQNRVGRQGRLFRVSKFRTMFVGSDRFGSVTTAVDDRITPIGRILRRTKLDEFPQLWNVLLGHMSFVGPRPDVPGYADQLQGDDRRVLELRPGITGPATLLFRHEEELLALARNPKAFNDAVIFPEKVRLNLAYLDHWSFWRDLGYIVATVAPFLTRAAGIDRRLGLDYEAFNERLTALAKDY
jgi:lipopolysaccharide/colanic/teichoic acid biosynthesis glycosyltransferase